jgi:RNA polymerase-binding transcription factor DksA
MLLVISKNQQREVSMKNERKLARKTCTLCGAEIPPARLAAIPGVSTCIACAKRNPPKVDVNKLDLSQASPIDRTGFAPSD